MDSIFKGITLRILLYLLNKPNQISSNGDIQFKLNIENNDFLYADRLLARNDLISSSKSHMSLTPAGIGLTKEYLKNELKVFHKTMKRFDYAFALLEFIRNREVVEQSEFPKELMELLPPGTNGRFMLGGIAQIAHENSQYINSGNNGIFTVTSLGDIHYEEQIEEYERNKDQVPYSFNIDNSVNITGDSNILAQHSSLEDVKATNKATHNAPVENKIRQNPIVAIVISSIDYGFP